MPIQTILNIRDKKNRKEGLFRDVADAQQHIGSNQPANFVNQTDFVDNNSQQSNGNFNLSKQEKSEISFEVLQNADRINENMSNQQVAISDQPKLLQNMELTKKSYSLIDIITEALNLNASDIHINPGYRVYARKVKELIMLKSQVITSQTIIGYINEMNRYDVVSSRNLLSELLSKDSTDFGISVGGTRLRVNIAKVVGGYSISIRLIPEKIKTLDELSLPASLSSLVKFDNGLVLITGSTGSGKTTTLASLINYLNLSQQKKIITLEDPIEYIYPKGMSIINQRNFLVDFMDWESGIKSALRQDPDVLMVGEIRDVETLAASLKLSETGHLVLATLHTNSASSTIQRMIDMFPGEQRSLARISIASSLRAVLTQQLIRTINGGVVPAIELMFVNNAIQNLIKKDEIDQINNVITTSVNEGMISMSNYISLLKSKGVI